MKQNKTKLNLLIKNIMTEKPSLTYVKVAYYKHYVWPNLFLLDQFKSSYFVQVEVGSQLTIKKISLGKAYNTKANPCQS